MTTSQKIQITEIITRTVSANMEAGATYEKALDQVFERLNKEHPLLLTAYINQ